MANYNHRGPAPYFRRPEDLPVVICGPIVRRVTRESVSVFVALKTAAADIRLSVYDTASPGGASPLATSASPCPTVALGRHLHVTVVTLKLLPSQWLQPEHRYGYDLSIDAVAISTDYERFLGKSTVEGGGAITYGTDTLPGFVAPAATAEKLRLLHGSCRKPHAEGPDMLAEIDDHLRHTHSTTFATSRPQILLLTGDQIYADDVSPILLRCLNDSLPIVLGWRETVPSPHIILPFGIPAPSGLPPRFGVNELESDGTWAHKPQPDAPFWDGHESVLLERTDPFRASRIAPPQRGEEVRLNGGLSSDFASAHLVFLGEYMLMYLLCWSDALWPRGDTGSLRLPAFNEAVPSFSLLGSYSQASLEAEGRRLATFVAGLGKVRRALANISTLMIFDDHEVTDDWNLNADWVKRVNASPMGPRVLRNALVAYALFQDWGSQPEDYESLKPGAKILEAVTFQVPPTPAQAWRPNEPPPPPDPAPALISGDTAALDALFAIGPKATRIGPPSVNPLNDDPTFCVPEKTWNYIVEPQGEEAGYRIIMLDTRTRRGFPSQSMLDQATSSLKGILQDAQPAAGLVMGAALLSDSAFQEQLESKVDSKLLNIVVAPAPVFNVAIVENVLQRLDVALKNPEHADNESWGGHPACFLKVVDLLLRKGQRGIILLSGDVHYAFSHKITVRDGLNGMAAHASLQLCSSSLLNESDGTILVGESSPPWSRDGIAVFSRQRGLEAQARIDAMIAGKVAEFGLADGFQPGDLAALSASAKMQWDTWWNLTPAWYDPTLLALKIRDINPFAVPGKLLLPMSLFFRAGVVIGGFEWIEHDFLPVKLLYEVEHLEDVRPATARAARIELVSDPNNDPLPPDFAKDEARKIVGYDNVGEVRVDSDNGILSVTHRLYWAAHDAAQRSTSALLSTEHTSTLTRN